LKAVEKAIWYIESHYGQQVTLDDLVQIAGLSRYHLSRVFSYTTGIPISRYLRDRRLSQAARALADGKSDILDLALSLGYGSHEAFSRAFKNHFGQTPESVRRQGHTDNLNLLEARRMAAATPGNLAEPRIAHGKTLLLAGLARKYTGTGNAAIPGQWQEFGPRIGNIPGQIGQTTFGVIYNMDDEDNHDYLCAVEVASFNGLPGDLTRLRLPEQTYAVFQHQKHISEILATCKAIWGEWLPNSDYEPADSPFFERYSESFNPATGHGGLEVWLPILGPK